MPVLEATGTNHNAGQAPHARSIFEGGQTEGKNYTTPPLTISSFHQFLHLPDGIQRIGATVLRHKSRLGGPLSPPDMSQATCCSTTLAYPDETSCLSMLARGLPTRCFKPAPGGVTSCSMHHAKGGGHDNAGSVLAWMRTDVVPSVVNIGVTVPGTWRNKLAMQSSQAGGQRVRVYR